MAAVFADGPAQGPVLIVDAATRRAPGARGEGPVMAADAGTALQRAAASATLSLSLQGAPRFGRGMDRGGTVGRRIVSPHAHFAAPSFPSWGSARGGNMGSDDLDESLDPLKHGVPFARAILGVPDFAEPEVWCAWVCAEAEEQLAQEQLKCAKDKARPAQEEMLRLWRHGIPVGMPMVQYQRLQSTWAPPDFSPPEPPFLERARSAAAGAKEKRDAAYRRAAANLRTRLGADSLRAFGRPGTIEAPWRWIAPHVSKQLGRSADPRFRGAVEGGNTRYFEAHVCDLQGLPLDQAACAYAARTPAPVARAAIGRRLLRVTARVSAEEVALAQLRLDLAARLRDGWLVAVRDGAALPREAFAPGAPLGDLRSWEGNDTVRVRPFEPSSRPALAPGDWRVKELKNWEREETWLNGWRPKDKRFPQVLTAMAAVAPPFLKPDSDKMEFNSPAGALIRRALEHLSSRGTPVDERAGSRPWKMVEDKWNSKMREAKRKGKNH